MFERASTIDDAIDEVRLLASSLPGDFTVNVVGYHDQTAIQARGTLVSSSCAVEIDLRVTENAGRIDVSSYRVDVRRAGSLVWRADKHTGHEDASGMGGRPEHRHVTVNGVERRIPDTAQTLQSIQRSLVSTNLALGAPVDGLPR